MKWFKHESDAHANIKLQAVIDKYGIAAYGYYWACIELVASQGHDVYQIPREKRWIEYFKKILGIEMEEQRKYLALFAKLNLIEKEAIRKGHLSIPKLADRSDEYTDKKRRLEEIRRVSRQGRENVGVDKNRIDKKRREKMPSASVSYLKNIPETDLKEFHDRFDASVAGIKSKAEDLSNWCEMNGKIKKNYKAFLLNALKKDFPLRPKQRIAPENKAENESEDDREKRSKALKEIRADLENGGLLRKQQET